MNENKTPLISVIMGIYNCSETLSEAIDSILNQTVNDWELILCDDGSTDDTYATACRFRDMKPEKIFVIRNKENLGLSKTLNHCLQLAKGEYIARMDGDDICRPDRFERELQVFASEPDLAIVSTDMAFFDENGIWGRISHPTYPQPSDFVEETPFCHAPCMVRKTAYKAVNGYAEEDSLLRVEDYDLWIRMYMAGFRGKNIHEPLYAMRDDRNAFKRRKFRYRLNETNVKIRAIRLFHLSPVKYALAVKPILVGLLPEEFYKVLHRKRLQRVG